MMPRMIVNAALAAAVLYPATAAGQFVSSQASRVADGDTARITTSGYGTVPVEPATATMYVELGGDGMAARDAALALAETRASVLEALTALGLGRDAVTEWGYGAGEAMDRMRIGPNAPDGAVPSAEAKAGLRIALEDPGAVDRVGAAVLAAGAAAIPYVAYEAGDTRIADAEAQRLAVSDAMRRGQALAEAAGGRLGRLVEVGGSPDFGFFPQGSQPFFQVGGFRQGVELQLSDLTVRASVVVTWQFLPGAR